MKNTALTAIIFLSLLYACSPRKGGNSEEEVRTAKQADEQPVGVQVMRLDYSGFNYELISNGTVAAMRKADLRFLSQENIQKIYVKNGERVAKGQQLAELNMFRLGHTLKLTENAYNRARLELQDVLIGQGYSLKDSVSIPAEVLRIAKIRSGFIQEQSNLALARYNLEAATLYAPFDGVVANLTAKEHNLPGSDFFCTIIDNRHPEIVFNVLEFELPLTRLNDKVLVSPFSLSTYVAEGKITEINPSIDKNGMVRVKASVNNKDNAFVEGMNVKVRIQRLLGEQLVIPKSALVLRTNRKVVFTLKNGRAQWNYVQTAQENSDSYVVTEGLTAGDSVICAGNINLAHESPVIINQLLD